MTTNLVHLSPAQKQLLDEFEGHEDRPSLKLYDAFQKRMRAVDPKTKPKPREIPNTRRGFERGEVKILDGFDATQHLPEGWALYSMHDSGGNHNISSAGQVLLTKLWNHHWF